MVLDFWYHITQLGWPWLWVGVSVVLTAVYFITRKRHKIPLIKILLLILIPSLALSLGITEVFKLTLDIPRPCVPCVNGVVNCNLYCPYDSAFPSGHAAAAFTGFTALFLTIRRKSYLLYIIPLLVAVSRVALGVHSILDVVAGSFLGVVVTVLVWKYEKMRSILK